MSTPKIEPVETSTTGFLGTTEKKPTSLEVVTSWSQFQNDYGGYISGSYLPYAVNGFFANGGQRCYIADDLDGLQDIDEVSIINAPNADVDQVLAVIGHCEKQNCFAIVDGDSVGDFGSIKPREKYGASKFAACYYPWLKIVETESGAGKFVPPGGSVAGIFARNDIEHGVYKAPANQIVIGATDLQLQISQSQTETLSDQGVNAIRLFPGRGIVLWGARTLSTNSEWKYVNVRRLMIFIENSIEKGTQWVVFEPNNEILWANVRAAIEDFLITLWRNGGLAGIKPEQAFFVKCDRTTMTQDDIDNGKLICLIGIAPVKPAEFVIFRIGQWMNGSEIIES
ncbi:MAG TPA: phage tail sheath C-terminal domain-containing protein [Acidobacteriota bacterium]